MHAYETAHKKYYDQYYYHGQMLNDGITICKRPSQDGLFFYPAFMTNEQNGQKIQKIQRKHHQ